MTFSLKTLTIACAVCLILGAALTRYSAQTPSTKEVVKTDTQKDTETHTVTTVEEQPNGVKKTTTVTDVSQTVSRQSDKTNRITPISNKPKNFVSGLGGYDVSRRTYAYGLHVQRELIGPVTVGVFGLSNNTYGISLGVNF